MGAPNQLSPGGAIAMGLTFAAAGIYPVLIGAGVLPRGPDDAPGWVAAAAGALFMCGGLAVAIDYGIAGGIGPDGDFKPGTPTAFRVINLLLGLAIIGLMSAISGWIAFGPGPRHFTSTLTLPFLPLRWQSDGLWGRIAFGIGAVLLAAMFVACGVSGVRRLQRGIIDRRT